MISRWETETTSLLSEGLDRGSNLDRSMMVSLSSPRVLATPDAQKLLSLLSYLPDGASIATLEQMKLPLRGLQQCTTTLLRTSLAYRGHDGRIKVLVPIREYMRTNSPPSSSLAGCASRYLYELVKLFERWEQSHSGGLVQRLSEDLGNIRSIAQYTIDAHESDLKEAVGCIIELCRFTHFTELGSYDIILRPNFEELVVKLADKKLLGEYLLAVAHLRAQSLPIEESAEKAISCFESVHDVSGQGLSFKLNVN